MTSNRDLSNEIDRLFAVIILLASILLFSLLVLTPFAIIGLKAYMEVK